MFPGCHSCRPMTDYFGHLVCECTSLKLVGVAITTPDATMEITEMLVICGDCDITAFESVDHTVVESTLPTSTGRRRRVVPND